MSGSEKYVAVRCKDEKDVLFQIYLRAGMGNQIQSSLKTRGSDVLHSLFFIDMNLNVKVESKQSTFWDTDLESLSDEQSVSPLDPFKKSTNKTAFPDDSNSGVKKYNTTMTVNPLHLAILAKQSIAVKYLMEHIFLSEQACKQQFFDTLVQKKVLAAKVTLEFGTLDPKLLSDYDRSLDGMNALHLACQYHPEAVEIIFDIIYKYKVQRTNIEKIVQDRVYNCGYTPLHIAAKKSLVNAAR